MEKKEDKFSLEEDIEFIKQLTESLEEAEEKLEEAYFRKEDKELQSSKEFMLQISDKIEEVLE